MTPGAATAPQVLDAPAAWTRMDFISDLHLREGDDATLDALARHLSHTPAQAVFILGDLFDVWVGDDVLQDEGFEARCARALRQASAQRALYFVCGNRDFLIGAAFLKASGMQGLSEPTLLRWRKERLLLAHGDALCLADRAYLDFRAKVRGAPWQRAFLAQSLAQRQHIAQGLRTQSRAEQARQNLVADVDAEEARRWLTRAGAQTLVHGHTHRAGRHVLGTAANGTTLVREVLSDWDLTAQPPRAQVLSLTGDGLQRTNLTDGMATPLA